MFTRNRRSYALVATALAALGGGYGIQMSRSGDSPAEAGPVVHVYKSPTCTCCGSWVDHMRRAGFRVEVTRTADVAGTKARFGVPAALTSCHTSEVEGYAVEGHVPASDVRRLLAERPAVRGIGVAGMPAGAPGMASLDPEPFATRSFQRDGTTALFEQH